MLAIPQLLRSRKRRQQKLNYKADRGRHLRFETLEDRRVLATFVVDTTVDAPDTAPGDGNCAADIDPLLLGTQEGCTLRAAIQEANAQLGPDTINFNIPTTDPGYNGEWWTIRIDPALVNADLSNGLPPLVDSGTLINGFSQPEDSADTDFGPGVNLVGTGGTVGVDGVTFNKFEQPEIAIDGNTAQHGFSIAGNASDITLQGMAVYDVGSLAVDGATIGEPNAIEANGGSGTDRVVREMFIGLLPNGSDPGIVERNKGFGARQFSGGVVGDGEAELEVTRSLVGYNGQGGLDGAANNTEVIFTYNEVFQNGWNSMDHDGIDVNGVNSIARFNLSYMNTNLTKVPTGSSGTGIELGSKSPTGIDNNIIENNTIRDNLSAGISIRKGPSGNFILKNEIFLNQVGIAVDTEDNRLTHRNQLSMNSIYMNMGLGIDLQRVGDGTWVGFAQPATNPGPGPDGINEPQDHCDPDTGSNDLQNHPELTSAFADSSSTQVNGTLDSLPNTTFTIEFFRTPIDDMWGVLDREGRYFIGSIQVTTGADCLATFNAHFAEGTPEDQVITATATKFTDGTEPWSTSEFSGAIELVDLSAKVTGGGWYTQPAATIPSPDLTDNKEDTVNFGFNAMYRKKTADDGTPIPEGKVNFIYREQDIHMLSDDFCPGSLIVTGGDTEPQKATWRGDGFFNQQSKAWFEINLTDNGEPGSMDTFHIRIWFNQQGFHDPSDPCAPKGTVRYDNGTETLLDGGNLQVHIAANALEVAGTMNLSVDWDGLRALSQQLDQAALDATVEHAMEQWREAGVDEAQLQALSQLQIAVGSLPDGVLGLATPGRITLDRDASGFGWFMDATPHDSSEFHAFGHDAQLAFVNSAAFGRMDLLTAVTHEMGHHLGFGHSHEHEAMQAALAPSTRMLPDLEMNHHEHHDSHHHEHDESHHNEAHTSSRSTAWVDTSSFYGNSAFGRASLSPVNVYATYGSDGASTDRVSLVELDAVDSVFDRPLDWRMTRSLDEHSSESLRDETDELSDRTKEWTLRYHIEDTRLDRLIAQLLLDREAEVESEPRKDRETHQVEHTAERVSENDNPRRIDPPADQRVLAVREPEVEEVMLDEQISVQEDEVDSLTSEVAAEESISEVAVDAVFAEMAGSAAG